MHSRWNDELLTVFAATCPAGTETPFIEQIFATRLLGSDPDLALHGGGNTSFKGMTTDSVGDPVDALFVKASGSDMGSMTIDDFVALDRARLRRLERAVTLDDTAMADFFRAATVRFRHHHPSIETLLHAFLPFPFIDHTHPAALLALTNRTDADACINAAFRTPVALLPYVTAGIDCGRAAAAALQAKPDCKGIIIGHHGLVTWGTTARQAYDATIRLVTEAETWLAQHRVNPISVSNSTAAVKQARERYRDHAPIIRGILRPERMSGEECRPPLSMVHLADERLLSFIDTQDARGFMTTTPLTPDYLIRTGRLPLFIDAPVFDDPQRFRTQVVDACNQWRDDRHAFMQRHSHTPSPEPGPVADIPFPRVMLIPGIGAICTGPSAEDARIVADITLQGLTVKQTIFATNGTYRDLDDDHCFNMEFRAYQRAKLHPSGGSTSLHGRIVLVTGAAGAIGNGVCMQLLDHGCQVAVSDLPGKSLDLVGAQLTKRFGDDAVVTIPMDVTSETSVRDGFACIVDRYGGIDAVVVNAGIAHVAPLAAMELEAFHHLERVNIEGTLLTIREAARLFTRQNCGGDIVLISTKNVFAPGASFGAYSATKAAAHQIARIASLELAPIDVRVNMVAPDAVFSHGQQKSGLWATVGPDRMKSRGLDEAGLEEYYRNRNLLKSKVTATHVAAAVEFFLERRTPTTGATIPVDGGLPDATPR